MKKLLSLTLALVLVLSLSALAFADTAPITDNATAVIPVSIRQEFIDEAPEGQYLTDLVRTEINEEFYQIEGTYVPYIQPRATTVSGSKYIKIYFDELEPAHILYYKLEADFSVPFNGSAATCTKFEYSKEYQYHNTNGYTFTVSETPTTNSNYGRLAVFFNAYWKGALSSSANYGSGSIACDEYGNVY